MFNLNDKEKQIYLRCKILISEYPNIYKYVIIVLWSLILYPLLIWLLYYIGDVIDGIPTSYTAGDLLGFHGSFLAFVGTVSLGCLALWQNHKLGEINKSLLGIEIYKNIPIFAHKYKHITFISAMGVYEYKFYIQNKGKNFIKDLNATKIEIYYEGNWITVENDVEFSSLFPEGTSFFRQIQINEKHVVDNKIRLKFTYSAMTDKNYIIDEKVGLNIKTHRVYERETQVRAADSFINLTAQF